MTEYQLIQWALDKAKEHLGSPYIWGGNNPFTGFDCSGFAQWYLKPMGLDPKGDQTAADLYAHFKDYVCEEIKPGCLLFYGKSKEQITHVAIAQSKYKIIEAGGGDSKNKTEADCRRNGGCVREMMANHRKDLVAILKPDYQGVLDEYSE